jgi:DNA-binding FadR family transcriptional regulator
VSTDSATDFTPRRPRGLVNGIVEALAASIRDGRLRPGDKLPTEGEIMARFEVSRTVVREALSMLQASDLVHTRHGIGTFVMEPLRAGTFRITSRDLATVADVISVLELRISLETEAAGLAAQRRTADNLQAMARALRQFRESMRQDSDAAPADFRFHLEIARATANRHFTDLMTHLGTMIIPRTRIDTTQAAPEGKAGYLRRVDEEHEVIHAAIRARDPDAARTAMRIHLISSRDRLQAAQRAPAPGRTARAASRREQPT